MRRCIICCFTRRAGARGRCAQDFALVATCANPGGEPLIIDDDEARDKLARIADLVVTHDRDIVARADDSVMQIVDGAPAFLRRARGFVPEPIDLGADGPYVLALRRPSQDDADGDARARSLRLPAYRRSLDDARNLSLLSRKRGAPAAAFST